MPATNGGVNRFPSIRRTHESWQTLLGMKGNRQGAKDAKPRQDQK